MNIGIIGLGYWGPNLVRNFAQMVGVNIKYICDLNPKTLENVKNKYHLAAATLDYREILDDPTVDAVAIATPVSTHYKLAKDALEAGKHLLLEKPMASSAKECEELVQIAEQNGLVLQVDHTFIYTGAVRKLKELVASGEVGDVLYFDSVRVNLGLFQHDVNVVWDLAPHDLSIIDHVLDDEVIAVSGTGVSHYGNNLENIAYVMLYLKSGAIAHLHLNWLSPVKVRQILIGGTKKMIVFDDMANSEKIKVYDKGVTIKKTSNEDIYKTLHQYRTGDMLAPKLDQLEALQYECEHFIHCIKEGETPMTDGHMGLRVVRLLEAIDVSIANEGSKVMIEDCVLTTI